MRRWLGGVLVVGATLGLALMGGPGAGAQEPSALRYAAPGPYAVGTRELRIEDGAGEALAATVWYPALASEGEAATYGALMFAVQGRAVRDAAPDAEHGPYPLVVFSHGAGGFRAQSVYFTEHLASHGFVVVAADHPGNTLSEIAQLDMVRSLANRPLEVLRVIAHMEALTAGEGPLAGLVDMERIAVSGHSFGGYTALAAGGARLNFEALAAWCEEPEAWGLSAEGGLEPDPQAAERARLRVDACLLRGAAERVAALRGLETVPTGNWPPTSDPRIRAVIAMAPWNGVIFGEEGLAALRAPTLVLVGSGDTTAPPERDAYTIYLHVGSGQKALAVFEGGGHLLFSNGCEAYVGGALRSLRLGCSDRVWDMGEAHAVTNHLATAFLRAVLYGEAEAAGALARETVDVPGVVYLAAGL